MLFGKRPGQITFHDIQELINNAVSEGKTIEYKESLSGGSDSEKKEFLADVCSFANTAGGHIVYGIKENGGLPTEIVGIESTDFDKLKQIANSIIESGIEPRIQFEAITLPIVGAENKSIIIICIDDSWNKPHRLAFRRDGRFYARNTSGKYEMDINQLRRSFLHASVIEEKISEFVAGRINKLINGPTIFDLLQTKLVVHIIPRISFISNINIDIQHVGNDILFPLYAAGWNYRANLYGKAWYHNDENRMVLSYTQLFRNGCIEALESSMLADDRKTIPSGIFEQNISSGVVNFIKSLNSLGVSFPYYLYISLLNISGYTIAVPDRFHIKQLPIREQHITLPETVINDANENIYDSLYETYNIIWNAVGYERSINYDNDGHWSPYTY